MEWVFWKKKRHSLDEQLGGINQQIAEMKDGLTRLEDMSEAGVSQSADFNAQIAKLARLQYKSGQEIQAGLAGLHQMLGQVLERQAELALDTAQVDVLNKQNEQLRAALIDQLDELDAVCARLDAAAEHSWQTVLNQWRCRISRALAEVGILEVEVVGKTFAPEIAECVGTVIRPAGSPEIPYEVAEVLRRGFITRDGVLLRKAQVVTYREDHYEQKNS
ncbi:MAG TPA: nucleotide exchange factor GrpE [Methylomusa anaerophila]|uniref:Protein GrpE n=1 Tax=Methylomusa anaerophila TaxID=1930071 RepID=A0A348ANH0_9FIRM|nr:nucleotide exchange factor GrpE [Methylomusa anaerophila]BBB92618.1 protein GrpE [Methylomusa anaerophila]HML87528.1 nucleotide exchange factor GrpE [Methylomusa anaerophila]